MSDLSILCITRFERHALPFIAHLRELAAACGGEFVLVADGRHAYAGLRSLGYDPHRVESDGYVESVLEDGLTFCERDYVLRLDDDECCSRAMERWIVNGAYRTANHWKFPRAHLWNDNQHMLVTPHLWPDHQTRLSARKFAGGRSTIHAGSPHGGGIEAPCIIEHHKFLVKTIEERREIVRRYDAIQANAGTSFRAFSVPEDFYTAEEIRDSIHPWDGDWHGQVTQQGAA